MSTIIYDGIAYDNEADVPDLGSFVAYEPYGHMLRNYYGLSADVSKLPKYVKTGSTAFCMDTDDTYMYESKHQTWNKL